jgi:cytoskeleton protein RodZ
MTESVDTRKTYGPYEFRLGDELRGERATLGRSLLDIQRDLRIKAAYIAAIENCDPSVFPNPSFVAGYVRSYARYLNLDPEEVYWRFCQESGFTGARSGAAAPAGKTATGAAPAKPPRGRRPAAGDFYPMFPLAEAAPRRLPAIPFSAIGSLIVLVALIGGLGYGGWAILQNIQRVQFAPIDEVPVALDDLPDLTAPVAGATEPLLPELAAPVAATALVDLYRQQELEVPILVPRDGPIAALDPDTIGLLAGASRPEPASGEVQGPPTPSLGDVAATVSIEPEALAGEQAEAADARPRLTVIAERPAWVRIYFANGTVLFEQILESGEIYEVPPTAEVPLIWAGNSGSVYVKVGEVLHGPIGSGTRAVRDVVLDPAKIGEEFEPVGELPSVISEAISNLAQQDLATIRQ